MKLRTTPIRIPAEGVWLDATLAHAPDVRGLVLILQPGSNPILHQRQTLVAGALQRAGFATLALDLLNHQEELHDPDARYNVTRLTDRLLAAALWIENQPPLCALSIGLLAFGTASAAIVRAAAKNPERFNTLVCLGGRPDLAGAGPLRNVGVPTLFVVSHDDPERAILRSAFDLLKSTRAWQDAGQLDNGVADLDMLQRSAAFAADWMLQHLPLPSPKMSDPDRPHSPPDALDEGQPDPV